MSAETPPTDPGGQGTVERWLERHAVSRTERLLWVVVVLAMAADATLTVYGLSLGLRELNPIARQAFESAGILGFLWLKGFAICIALVGRWLTPNSYGDLIPATLAIPWVVATILNAITLLVAT